MRMTYPLGIILATVLASALVFGGSASVEAWETNQNVPINSGSQVLTLGGLGVASQSSERFKGARPSKRKALRKFQ
jgi:hypothetical protein